MGKRSCEHRDDPGGPRYHWSGGKGFERLCGFLAGETAHYRPDLIWDEHQVYSFRTPEEGKQLPEDFADQEIGSRRTSERILPRRHSFFAPLLAACHALPQAPASLLRRGQAEIPGWVPDYVVIEVAWFGDRDRAREARTASVHNNLRFHERESRRVAHRERFFSAVA